MGLLDEAIREHLELKRRGGADPSEVDRLEREALGPVRRSPQDPADIGLDDEDLAGAPYLAEDERPYLPGEEEPEWVDSAPEPIPFDHAPEPGAGAPPAERWSEPPTQVGHLPHEEAESVSERTYESPRHHEIAEEWEAHERGLTAEPAGFEPDEPAPAPPVPAPDPYTGPPPAGVSGGPVFGEERQRPLPPEPYALDQETAEYHLEDEEEEEVEAEPAEPREGEDVLEETPEFLQDTPDHDRLWFEQRPPRDFDFDN
jgi:hypothetical protein